MLSNVDFAIRLTAPKFLLEDSQVRALFLSGATSVLSHHTLDVIRHTGKSEEDIKPFSKVSEQSNIAYTDAVSLIVGKSTASRTARCEFRAPRSLIRYITNRPASASTGPRPRPNLLGQRFRLACNGDVQNLGA